MSLKRVIKIGRTWGDRNQTLGTCKVMDEHNMPLFVSLSLERGWRDNQQNISCIPLGEYPVVLEWSPKFEKNLWEIKEVPGRSETKFHSANYWHQLNGCIALGLRLRKIDGDEYYDVTNSNDTMKEFHSVLEGATDVKLIIYNEN